MHIEKQTIIAPVITGDEIDPCKPVLSFASSIYNGRCADAHADPRAQIIYATEGVMKVVTPQHVWMITPMQAIWIPGMEMHQVSFPDRVEVRNFFLDPSVTAHLPTTSFAFDVTSFFKELVLRIIKFSHHTTLSECEYRIVQVLLDEISALPPAALHLPVGKDDRVQIVTDHLIQHMQADLSLEEAASLACVSARTLSRLFVSETGMPYRDWCIKLKLLEAIRRLQKGETIAQVAFDLGYESTSAFTYMFRKSLGKPPCIYLREMSGL